MDEVLEENSMILYPGTFDTSYEADPRSLYLRSGYRLPKPIKMALHAGEMLVFNPELLHATHLNVSAQTRIALSARINPAQPRFDPGCFYAREFWHSSIDIKAGRTDIVRQFRRDEHLETTLLPAGPVAERIEYVAVLATPTADGWHTVARDALDRDADRHLVALQDGRSVALFREGGGWLATQSTCPHLDLSLLDGYCDGQRIHCAAHGMTYDVTTGCSSSDRLRLDVYDVEDVGAAIHLKRRER
jgi:nitrite reductase/ring-hydroxylating ferredoxin subunit